jgi:hypothetical protein
MCGLGMLAYSRAAGDPMLFGLHVDDCLPEKTGTVKTLRGLPPHNMVRELSVLPQVVRRRPSEPVGKQIQRVARWSRSVGVTRDFVRAQVHAGRALWRGEAGTFTAHLSPEQAIILHAFNNNGLNGRDSYEQKLAHLPHVRIIDEPSWHLDLAQWDVFDGSAKKIRLIQEELESGTRPAELIQLPELAKPFFPKKKKS